MNYYASCGPFLSVGGSRKRENNIEITGFVFVFCKGGAAEAYLLKGFLAAQAFHVNFENVPIRYQHNLYQRRVLYMFLTSTLSLKDINVSAFLIVLWQMYTAIHNQQTQCCVLFSFSLDPSKTSL